MLTVEVMRLACLRLLVAWVAVALSCLPALAQDLTVSPQGWAELEGKTYPCALGRGGVKQDKREGDGATPAGSFALRQIFYRQDKSPTPPASGLPVSPLAPDWGWCDEAGHPEYNRLVKLPFTASHEELWREDGLYDLIVVVGYNDDPPVPGLGSAIFVHVARPGLAPTAGCVAFNRGDLLEIVSRLGPRSRVRINSSP